MTALYRQSVSTLPPAYTLSRAEGSNSNAISLSAPQPGAPPRYSAVFGDPEQDEFFGAQPTEHEYFLRSGLIKSKPWARLRIRSRPSSTPNKAPKFFGGDNIAGMVGLNLDSPQVVNSISLLLRGRIVTSFAVGGSYTFLEYSHNVWNKSAGDPRGTTAGQKFNGKLLGNFEFPFSFPFAVEADILQPSSGSGKRASRPELVYRLPQSILEHNLKSNVEYELALHIAHGPFRADSTLKASVIFIPEITPDPPSVMRQNAYMANSRLPGPETDLEGWVSLPKLLVKGLMEKCRHVELEYSLYLASPLCYTRGTVIPCYLVISSQDSRSLELLASPKLQYIRLARRVTLFENPLKGIEQHVQGKQPKVLEEFDEAELAVWWSPPKDVLQDQHVKRLEGEIHLAKELPPSSNFLPFSIEVSHVMSTHCP
ncbi:hypothetical protein GALMADRAFT_54975 [Galerina marginata CBS 339.88]|uniref:Arrestin-like N-terminal domain-containing protein n=1 Tax=Galerina marginata (strain CBS 339.88) TaxID=685588 RepID=A0A067TPK0_GALM3|nr:hypothetical protein GALMADRAFT_54975 [Galerina marginata CBS 339.88]